MSPFHKPPPLITAEFFTGIGGFVEGFKQAGGMETVCMTEWDPSARMVLKRHYPDIPLLEDISDVTAADLPGRVDLFAGGFPCGDTTTAKGHRLGLAGTRSRHFHEFTRLIGEYARIVDSKRPRWVVIENPEGLLTSPGKEHSGRDMDTVIRTLRELGYVGGYRVVDGSKLGTAQRRRRVLIVGHRGTDPRPAWQVLGDPGPGGEALAPCPGRFAGPRPDLGPHVAGGGLVRHWTKGANSQVGIEHGYEGGYRENWKSVDYANTLTGFDGHDAARSRHLIAQNGGIRTWTYTEKERLQGFPDGWTEGVRLGDLRRKGVLIEAGRDTLLGNAIHTGTSRWFGRRVVAVHNALPLLEVA